jgi:hypothetical protein
MDMKQRKPFKAAGVVELEPRTEFSLYCAYLILKLNYQLRFGSSADVQDTINALTENGC